MRTRQGDQNTREIKRNKSVKVRTDSRMVFVCRVKNSQQVTGGVRLVLPFLAAGAFLAAFFLGSFLAAAPILKEALTLTNW